MAQLFSPGADTLLRTSLVVGLLATVGAGFAASTLFEPFYVTSKGHTVDQPVPFSHLHHVSDAGIHCRYCHESVETSDFAGIPPTHTCMSCHSQILTDSEMLEPVRKSYEDGTPIHWTRVYDLPDFVQFSHQAHIGNGVPCEKCHGRVDRMGLTRQAIPLTMQFCLKCHRNPGPSLRPKDHVYDMGWTYDGDRAALGKKLMKRYDIDTDVLTNCSTCHF